MTFDQYLELVLPHATRPYSKLHGIDHWRRVAENGAALVADTARADGEVVAAFAALHDSQRWNENSDPRHGLRAAMLLLGIDLDNVLDREQRVKLVVALVGHNEGHLTDDPTIGCCWDADRLDMPRTGQPVDASYLSTVAAIALLRSR